jgi:enoyl-CoA hydratase
MNTVLYDRKEQIAQITFNRPHALNAASYEMSADLLDALRLARDDREAKVIILRGEGRAFCAGADVKEGLKPMTIDERLDQVAREQNIGRIFLELSRFGKPSIAAIQGYALGGGLAWALSCDLRIAAEGTRLGFPETAVGATVTGGGTYLLSRVIGLARAKEMLLTAEVIDAKEAERWGLVNKVVPADALDREAMDMAKKIAKNYPMALRLTKISVDYGLDTDFEVALELEAQAATLSFVSAERQKGMATRSKKAQ